MEAKTTREGEFIRYKRNADGIKAQLQRCGRIIDSSPPPPLTLDALEEMLYRAKLSHRTAVKCGQMPEVEMRFYGDEKEFIAFKNSVRRVCEEATLDRYLDNGLVSPSHLVESDPLREVWLNVLKAYGVDGLVHSLCGLRVKTPACEIIFTVSPRAIAANA